jgi:hypothetical protein
MENTGKLFLREFSATANKEEFSKVLNCKLQKLANNPNNLHTERYKSVYPGKINQIC